MYTSWDCRQCVQLGPYITPELDINAGMLIEFASTFRVPMCRVTSVTQVIRNGAHQVVLISMNGHLNLTIVHATPRELKLTLCCRRWGSLFARKIEVGVSVVIIHPSFRSNSHPYVAAPICSS